MSNALRQKKFREARLKAGFKIVSLWIPQKYSTSEVYQAWNDFCTKKVQKDISEDCLCHKAIKHTDW